MSDCQMRTYTKLQPSTQCRACGTNNISKYVNNFLSKIPTILILSSLVSEFRRGIQISFFLFFFFFFFFFGAEGGGGVKEGVNNVSK